MNRLLQDVRFALRTLRKTPGVAATVVFSLAIGIGANTAIFSVVDALLLRPLPYPDSDRLVNIWINAPGIGIFLDWPSPGQFIDVRNGNHSFEEMGIAQLRPVVLTGRERPERIDAMKTSSSLLRMLGARPMLGRMLLAEDDAPGKAPVAVLSHRLWRRLFSSDARVAGSSITLDGAQYTVAGVLAPEFSISSEAMPSESPMEKIDLFLPLPLDAGAEKNRGEEDYNVVARLKPGISIQQAQADVDLIAARIREKDKRDRSFGMPVTGMREQIVGDVRRALLVLLGSVALVLLVACANVAGLLLTRAVGRQKEVALRIALGASGARIVRQLLTESVLLSLAGGLAGLLVARWTLDVVHALNPGNIPRLEDIRISGPVLAFTFAVSVLTGILFGLVPAWRALAVDLNSSLKSGGRSGQPDGGMKLSRNRLRGLLVASEVALSLILLTGSGLLIRSFIRLQSVAPGFSTDRILSAHVVLNGPKYKDRAARINFYRSIEDRVAHLPGVESMGVVSALPLAGDLAWTKVGVEGYTPPPGQELQADVRTAGAGYFETMSIPLRSGRFFNKFDTPDSDPAAIVDESFARRFWPNGGAIGKHIWFNPKRQMTIVGVAGVVKQYGLDAEGKIAVYVPHTQAPTAQMYLAVRSSADAAILSNAVDREVHTVEPDAVVHGVRTMDSRLRDSLARRRFSMIGLGAFAGFAMLLAAVGVYGVLSHLVSQGTHDIGVRMALGAQAADIRGLVVRQGMTLAGAGIAAGLAGAWVLTRLMSGLLFGVTARDTLTFVAVAVILAAAALAASAVPAFRATGVDPMVALRDE